MTKKELLEKLSTLSDDTELTFLWSDEDTAQIAVDSPESIALNSRIIMVPQSN